MFLKWPDCSIYSKNIMEVQVFYAAKKRLFNNNLDVKPVLMYKSMVFFSERVNEQVRVSSLLSRMTKSDAVKSESSAHKISDILSKLAKPSQREKTVTEKTDSIRKAEDTEPDSDIETDVRRAKK